MNFIPGFYCGTAAGVYLVDYCGVPDVRIFDPDEFARRIEILQPGKKIYAEFNQKDLKAWERLHQKGFPIYFRNKMKEAWAN